MPCNLHRARTPCKRINGLSEASAERPNFIHRAPVSLWLAQARWRLCPAWQTALV